MQGLNWNDLRYLLALARAGSLAGAAKRLGVDATTVARRLRAAETALGCRVFERLPDGVLRLTQCGETVLQNAEEAESAIVRLAGAVTGATSGPAGRVRVTAVPILIGRVLIPAAAALARQYPALTLELNAEPRDVSLTRRDADIAVRFARPSPEAGQGLLTRKLGQLTYAAYASVTRDPADDAALPWIGYGEVMAALPQARWLSAAARSQPGAGIAVNDAEALIQAIKSELGRSILPRVVGEREPGLRQTELPSALPPLPSRELWLLTHPDLRSLARVQVVTHWLTATIAALADGVTTSLESGIPFKN